MSPGILYKGPKWYLCDLVFYLSGREAGLVPYGPSKKEFYPLANKNQAGAVLHYSQKAEKGSDLLSIGIHSLLQAGIAVTTFGAPSAENKDCEFEHDPRVTRYGFLSPPRVRQLFQNSMYYIDASHYEGLGMLNLEALFCGAVPVTLNNGGASRVIIESGAGIIINGAAEMHLVGEKLAKEAQNIDVYRKRFGLVSEAHNQQIAISAIREYMK